MLWLFPGTSGYCARFHVCFVDFRSYISTTSLEMTHHLRAPPARVIMSTTDPEKGISGGILHKKKLPVVLHWMAFLKNAYHFREMVCLGILRSPLEDYSLEFVMAILYEATHLQVLIIEFGKVNLGLKRVPLEVICSELSTHLSISNNTMMDALGICFTSITMFQRTFQSHWSSTEATHLILSSGPRTSFFVVIFTTQVSRSS